jgi:hypothetical protein
MEAMLKFSYCVAIKLVCKPGTFLPKILSVCVICTLEVPEPLLGAAFYKLSKALKLSKF